MLSPLPRISCSGPPTRDTVREDSIPSLPGARSPSAFPTSGGSGKRSRTTTSSVASVQTGENAIPVAFLLYQNSPNPFNPTTTIRYGLPQQSHVTLTIYNTPGQQVALLQNGEQGAGYHEVKFDPRNLGSGVYFYKLHAGDFVEIRRLLLVR